jgi:hypothetical protein
MQENSDSRKRVKPPADEEQTKEEQDLDEALYDTFPASDPLPASREETPPPPSDKESDRKRKVDEVKRK